MDSLITKLVSEPEIRAKIILIAAGGNRPVKGTLINK